MSKQWVQSGTPWESQVGYSRAVKAGNHIYVSGTIASDLEGSIQYPDDPYQQTKYIFNKIETALNELDASLLDVVRTRMFVTNIDHLPEIGRAHQEAVGQAAPAATMVEVRRFAHPNALVEIEVDAFLKIGK